MACFRVQSCSATSTYCIQQLYYCFNAVSVLFSKNGNKQQQKQRAVEDVLYIVCVTAGDVVYIPGRLCFLARERLKTHKQMLFGYHIVGLNL